MISYGEFKKKENLAVKEEVVPFRLPKTRGENIASANSIQFQEIYQPHCAESFFGGNGGDVHYFSV